MRILYVYEGERKAALEDEVLGRLSARHGGVRQVETHSGEGGMTTVTLEADEADAAEIVEALRGRGDILDAAQGSLGEGV